MRAVIHDVLSDFIIHHYHEQADTILSYLPPFPMQFSTIKMIMINEVVADIPEHDFYSLNPASPYVEAALTLFQKSGIEVNSIQEIVNMGIYITSAVKLPKRETSINTEAIKYFTPILEEEVKLFPSLKAIMLMGDVAKKAINVISKNESGKNAVPSLPTYKLRHAETMYKGIRLFPAYIMTGKNILIEKSKVEMSAEELSKMIAFVNSSP